MSCFSPKWRRCGRCCRSKDVADFSLYNFVTYYIDEVQINIHVNIEILYHKVSPLYGKASANELQHDKTNKIICVLNKDSDQPGDPPSLISLRFVL